MLTFKRFIVILLMVLLMYAVNLGKSTVNIEKMLNLLSDSVDFVISECVFVVVLFGEID